MKTRAPMKHDSFTEQKVKTVIYSCPLNNAGVRGDDPKSAYNF